MSWHSVMISLLLICALFINSSKCCKRQNCSLQATDYRGSVDCSLYYHNYCPPDPYDYNGRFPTGPRNLQVTTYRTEDDYAMFNISWQAQLDSSIEDLKGYYIGISILGSSGEVSVVGPQCIAMKFTGLPAFQPGKESNVNFYVDCIPGYPSGLTMGKLYNIYVQSLPTPSTNDQISLVQTNYKLSKPCLFFNEHGTIRPFKQEYFENETITVGCNDGYKLHGSKSIQCILGKWSDITTVCQREVVVVTTYANDSAMIDFSSFSACSRGFRVRIRNSQSQPSKFVDYNVSGYTKMFHDIPIQEWDACVGSNCNESPQICKQFHITGPPTTAATETTTAAKTTTAAEVATSSEDSIKADSHAPVASNNMNYELFSLLGCVVGILVVCLMWYLKQRNKQQQQQQREPHDYDQSNMVLDSDTPLFDSECALITSQDQYDDAALWDCESRSTIKSNDLKEYPNDVMPTGQV